MRRLYRLVAEGARVAASQLVGSLVGLGIAAAVTGVIIATTGQTALSERQVLSRVDDVGTRSVTVTDLTGSAGLRPELISRLLAVDEIESAIALGPARDGRNSYLGDAGVAVPSRIYYGEIPLSREWPLLRPVGVGEGLVGPEAARRLGLARPVGFLRVSGSADVAVVGALEADGPLEFLSRGVAVRGDPDDPTAQVRSVHVVARSPQDVVSVTAAVRSLLGSSDPGSLRVETSATLAGIRAAVAGDLGRFGRQIVAIVLAVGLALMGLNVYGAVSARRRDFGRRRALGASRPTIMVIVAVQTLVPVVIGAAVGSAVGTGLVLYWTAEVPPLDFVVATGFLTCLAGGLACLPPAAVAAFRDPIRVLRIP